MSGSPVVNPAAIEVTDLVRTFRRYDRVGAVRRRRVEVDAVRGLSLTVAPGSLVGYLGPNGAGKSTTVKMLTGILVPTSGRVRVLGLDPARERITLARRIGVMFGQRVQLWWDLPLADSFELLRHIYRVPAARHRANLDRFRELLDLDSFLATPVRQLSLGQRIRGELVASMLHDPEVLFLDEPTIGLDVVAKARVREFLAEINRERALVVDLEEERAPLDVAGATVVRVDGPRQWLRFRREETTAAQLAAAVGAQATLLDLSVEEPDIEDVVQRIYAEPPHGT